MSLTLEVLAGMANRIRSLISGICLAEDLDLNLHVIWSANDPACMIPFQELFDVSSLPRWVRVDMGPREGSSVEVLSPDDLEMYLATSSRPLQIRSYGHFYQKDPARWLKHLRALRPAEPFPETKFLDAVGVHIRRGDHKKAKMFSPIDAFINTMKALPEDTYFVVATDSMPEKTRLIEEFGSARLWFPATSLSRMTRQGMKSALADFIALSKCKKILGSFDSSFSQIAALYGDVPLEVVKG
uniref:Glycosyltransferase n=1 Tax=viral metagenome TaxID=1070528 RepID=A0A6C0BLE5_9ZZZZ